jgi:hypothetical protein
LYAYTVVPQRRVDESEAIGPSGGGIRLTPKVREVVENAFKKIAASALTTVDFEFEDDRSHAVRDEVMAVAFGPTQTPKAAAARLAARLSGTMDNRSHSALLLVTVENNDQKRRVSMLLLPKEDVVQLRGTEEDLLLDLIQDAFSTGSGLRKLARLTGHNARTQFLSAEVLDFQLMSAQKSVADFWIREFLSALPRMDSQTGTKHLASALQRAFDAAPEDERDAVFAAIFKASSGMVKKTSLAKYAEELPPELSEAYFRGMEDGEIRSTVFDVDRTIIKMNLARRIITGKDGVVISAPAETVGKSVAVTKKGSLRLVNYSGTIEKERVVRGKRGEPE